MKSSNEQVNNKATAEQSSLRYNIINLQYYYSNGKKTLVKYERNGIKKEIELNGMLDKETALHVLQKRNF